MNNNNNHNLLQTIDSIDDIIIESEINVINALMESYNKALTILENYNGDDLSSFSIFQEEYIMESKKDKKEEPQINNNGNGSKFRPIDEKTGKKENIIKSIVMVIPRLLKTLLDFIKKKFIKKKNNDITEIAQEINNMDDEKKKIFNNVTKAILIGSGVAGVAGITTGIVHHHKNKNKDSNNDNNNDDENSENVVTLNDAILKSSYVRFSDPEKIKKMAEDVAKNIENIGNKCNSCLKSMNNSIKEGSSISYWSRFGFITKSIEIPKLIDCDFSSNKVTFNFGSDYAKYFIGALDVITTNIIDGPTANGKHNMNVITYKNPKPFTTKLETVSKDVMNFIKEIQTDISEIIGRYNDFLSNDTDKQSGELKMDRYPDLSTADLTKLVQILHSLATQSLTIFCYEYDMLCVMFEQYIRKIKPVVDNKNKNVPKSNEVSKGTSQSEHKKESVSIDENWFKKVKNEIEKIQNLFKPFYYKKFTKTIDAVINNDGDLKTRFIDTNDAIKTNIYQQDAIKAKSTDFVKITSMLRNIGYKQINCKTGDQFKGFSDYFDKVSHVKTSNGYQAGKIESIQVQPFELYAKVNNEELQGILFGRCNVYEF